eukprot:gene41508-56148_t
MPPDLPVLVLPMTAVCSLDLPTAVIGRTRTGRSGESNEHTAYPGTLTLSHDTLFRLWYELGESVHRAGCRKLIIFNSHGGQPQVMEMCARELRLRHGDFIVVPSFTWRVPHVAGKYLSDTEKKLAMHAGHAETALMLALAPDTVHMERAVINYPPVFDSPLLSPAAPPRFHAVAENAEVWDVEGRRYIDFAGGIAVLNTGHRNTAVIEAVKAQLDLYTHTCFQVLAYEPYVELAERINAMAPGDFAKKTLFLTTGAEAVENAVKIARAAELGILAEETHHDGFAVEHRDNGDADIDLGVLDTDLDAAVLRETFFRDIEVREDLHARDDRGLEAFDLRGHRHLLENAVDAVADAQFVLEGLEVHVGGAQLDRVLEDLIDETDDRRVLGGLIEIVIGAAVLIDDLQAGLVVERVDRIG